MVSDLWSKSSIEFCCLSKNSAPIQNAWIGPTPAERICNHTTADLEKKQHKKENGDLPKQKQVL